MFDKIQMILMMKTSILNNRILQLKNTNFGIERAKCFILTTRQRESYAAISINLVTKVSKYFYA